jgi:hypothetical protein
MLPSIILILHEGPTPPEVNEPESGGSIIVYELVEQSADHNTRAPSPNRPGSDFEHEYFNFPGKCRLEFSNYISIQIKTHLQILLSSQEPKEGEDAILPRNSCLKWKGRNTKKE